MGERSHTWLKRWWRRASLVQRLVLVTLVPCLLTSSLLVVLLTRQQLDSLRLMAHEAARAIAAETAAVCAEPLARGDRTEVRHVLASIGRLSHVVRVQITTADGEVFSDDHGLRNGAGRAPSLRSRQPIHAPGDPQQVIGTVTVDVSLTRALEVQREGVAAALRWLAVSVVLALLVAWQEARWISAPLRKLVEAMQQLGAGHPPQPVTLSDETEIGQLQRGFNTAARALHESRQQLERRIEEATRELAQKNAALESASVDKARFLAAATHDLRQPLYALTLFSSSLAVDETDPVRLERIAHVQESIATLDKLFGELLDLSRLESGAMQPVPGEFALDGLFDEVSRNFRLLAEQNELRLVIRPTPLWVRSDRIMLARIVNNLVSNALRYTREGGVLVAARRRGDQVRIDVWDSGRGIAEEHHERVFEEFYRVREDSDETAAGPRTGLGLGLATVQRLAQLIGTRVVLRSRRGHGSLFTFTVPLAASGAGAPAPAPAKTATDTALQGLQVLVVDDDPAILAGIRPLLQSWGCAVRVAADREQALLAVEDWVTPVDMVISDLSLRAGRNGLEVLAALTAHYRRDGHAEPPFASLLITGETERERLRAAQEAGVPILFKPVAPGQLREAMAALLALHDDTRGTD